MAAVDELEHVLGKNIRNLNFKAYFLKFKGHEIRKPKAIKRQDIFIDEHAYGGTTQEKLETLGAQRAGLEDMLKEMKRKDDILPKLMTSIGSHEDLFRNEVSTTAFVKKFVRTLKLKNSF